MKSIKILLLLISLSSCANTTSNSDWFEEIKLNSDKTQLYRLLYQMPKGGDLHNHLSGAGFSEWWYQIAIDQKSKGYNYYTKTNNIPCQQTSDKNLNFYSFQNISAVEYQQLPSCLKQQFTELSKINDATKTQWLNSIRLDKADEGREEFFERHWQRLNALITNPYITSELIYKNMQAFSAEGLIYIEFQVSLYGFKKPDGSAFTELEVANVYRQRLKQKDAINTGVTIRFQIDLLRFLPDAEKTLIHNYQFIHENRDLWLAINMVGREDDSRGQPKRFTSTMQAMTQKYPNVRASIHAGESELANSNIRDTLAMGADRIGHGVNLFRDKNTLEKMQHGNNLIEINLISNLLLGYVESYQQHPFPIYLRSGIPVTLSTDDRGMWDSTMTDEYFVAVTEFDLSWDEVKIMIKNSIVHAFINQKDKAKLLEKLNANLQAFENTMRNNGVSGLHVEPKTRSFICKEYQICIP